MADMITNFGRSIDFDTFWFP